MPISEILATLTATGWCCCPSATIVPQSQSDNPKCEVLLALDLGSGFEPLVVAAVRIHRDRVLRTKQKLDIHL